MSKNILFVVYCFIQFCSGQLQAQELNVDATTGIIGDIGLGADSMPKITRSSSADINPVPYLNFDYGKFFARVDMFGYSLVPAGYGALELVTRVIKDGYTPTSPYGDLSKRKSSFPIGLGTLQISPIGAILVNVYHDVNQSGGNLADVLFAEEVHTFRTTLYPQVGTEYRSREYVRYFYGLSNADAARIKTSSYQPGDATDLFIDLFIEQQIVGNWYLNANIRKTWLDDSISNSPLVNRRVNTTGLVAVSYRFQ